MNTLYKDLIYLLSCAVNGIAPDTAKVEAMDLERLYRLAKFHTAILRRVSANHTMMCI